MTLSPEGLPAVGHSLCLVVVVDDDTPVRETLVELLVDEGYAVVSAGDGREALDKLQISGAQTPCLILLDLMMPVMTGAQFRHEQQLDPKLAAIPVCLISADGNLRKKAESLGCDFLEKPVRIEQIIGVVEHHCGPGPACSGQ